LNLQISRDDIKDFANMKRLTEMVSRTGPDLSQSSDITQMATGFRTPA
jgi:hypothetical protein